MATPAEIIRSARKAVDRSAALDAAGGWYHSFIFPDGTRIAGLQSSEALAQRFVRLGLPSSLEGKTALDVGAWDGWFSFELEKRGARVTAIDCVPVENFLFARNKFGSQAEYHVAEVYKLAELGFGKFDYVLFLGVLYHLKHPLLALEVICSITAELAIVESFVTDADNWQDHTEDIPSMEFYETDELGRQVDNWIGPTVGCLMSLCRAAGFARVKLLRASGVDATLACYRTWEPEPTNPSYRPPVLDAVVHNRNAGINFSSSREEYLSWWFSANHNEVTRDQVRLEVGGLGVQACYVGRSQGKWLANSRLPPGLTPGWKDARLRIVDTSFSNSIGIAVDIAPRASELYIAHVADGVTWEPDCIINRAESFVTCWIGGLGANCDCANVCLFLDGRPLNVTYVGGLNDEGLRQVNARIDVPLTTGQSILIASFGGVTSQDSTIAIR